MPNLIFSERSKLRTKGVKKIVFDFKEKRIAIWSEGKHDVELTDIRSAMPGLELRLVAKAAFPE